LSDYLFQALFHYVALNVDWPIEKNPIWYGKSWSVIKDMVATPSITEM